MAGFLMSVFFFFLMVICRGDVPFCSEECRQEKMDEDEAKEKKLSLSSTMKALRKKSTSPTRNQDYSYRTSTVAAA